jgi:glycosyltransferase involved in cell wall biosynthesis
MTKLKIAFILPGGGPSGGVRCTVVAANQLQQRGHDVRLLVNKKDTLKGCIRRCIRNVQCHPTDWVKVSIKSAEYFKDIRKCHFSSDELVVASGWWAAREIKKLDKRLLKVHHVRGIGSPDDNIMRDCWEEPVPKIVVASYLKEFIKRVVAQEVFAVVTDGIELRDYYPDPKYPRTGIGTIFKKGYHKDPDTIIQVFKRIKANMPGADCYLFGAEPKPKELSCEYIMQPPLEMARQIYSRCKVWLLCSRSEGFGLPILEAMACGCAVVATDCGGPKDMIQNGFNGFLCEVGNTTQIVDKICVLLDDEDLRRQFVSNSQEIVQEFSWDHSIDKLEKTLLDIYRASAK